MISNSLATHRTPSIIGYSAAESANNRVLETLGLLRN
jgi:hypothetical protein